MKGSERELPILWQQQQRKGVRTVSHRKTGFIHTFAHRMGSQQVLIPFL